MTHQLLNTLFVQTQGAYIHIKDDTLRVQIEGETGLRVPFHHLGGAVVFGNVLLSPFLIHRFADDGRSIAWFTEFGRFKARMNPQTSGNVLLRSAQHQAATDIKTQLYLARRFITGKVHNARQLLLRGRRASSGGSLALDECIDALERLLREIETVDDLAALRGMEGRAAVVYFQALRTLLRVEDARMHWEKRTRRPPRDRFNAVLSFAYSLLVNDCAAACEGVGLDPQVGFLHVMRPGRPALALDLGEEFRPVFGDRFVMALFNRKQLKADDFLERPGGSFELTENGRRTFLESYQRRKQDEISHPLLKQRVSFGLLPHIQARLLARYIRGDAQDYVPYVVR